jgi:hypothetical protein
MKAREYRQPGEPGAPTTPNEPTWIPIPALTAPELCTGPTCGATIYKVPHPKTGNTVPVSCAVEGAVVPDPLEDIQGRGISHFIDCPDRDQFGRGAREKLR